MLVIENTYGDNSEYSDENIDSNYNNNVYYADINDNDDDDNISNNTYSATSDQENTATSVQGNVVPLTQGTATSANSVSLYKTNSATQPVTSNAATISQGVINPSVQGNATSPNLVGVANTNYSTQETSSASTSNTKKITTKKDSKTNNFAKYTDTLKMLGFVSKDLKEIYSYKDIRKSIKEFQKAMGYKQDGYISGQTKTTLDGLSKVKFSNTSTIQVGDHGTNVLALQLMVWNLDGRGKSEIDCGVKRADHISSTFSAQTYKDIEVVKDRLSNLYNIGRDNFGIQDNKIDVTALECIIAHAIRGKELPPTTFSGEVKSDWNSVKSFTLSMGKEIKNFGPNFLQNVKKFESDFESHPINATVNLLRASGGVIVTVGVGIVAPEYLIPTTLLLNAGDFNDRVINGNAQTRGEYAGDLLSSMILGKLAGVASSKIPKIREAIKGHVNIIKGLNNKYELDVAGVGKIKINNIELSNEEAPLENKINECDRAESEQEEPITEEPKLRNGTKFGEPLSKSASELREIHRKAVDKYDAVKALDSTIFKNVHDVASFLKSIPGDSNASPWKQSETIAEAYKDKFVWTDSEGNKWFAEAHGADSSADAGPNASTGWVYRVSVKIKGQGSAFYLGSDGEFYSAKMFNPASPNYSSTVINGTHIPINK